MLQGWQWRLGIVLLSAGIAFGLFSGSAQAASITVNNSCDIVDAIIAANTDSASGSCPAGSGADTLILTDHITLTVTNNGVNGLPVINSTITIEGNGYTIARKADAGNFRLFEVNASGNLSLNEVTLTGGSLIVYDQGGAIASAGILQISNSTISGNSAGIAGAITASGVTTITNSTISGNHTVTFGAGAIGNGGTMSLFNTTVTGNYAANLGGAFDNGGILNLNRSIIAGNTAGTAREIRNVGTLNADAYNIFGYNNSSGVDGYVITGTDIVPSVNIAAILNTTLADNGGGTFTHALVEGSPAIDTANDSGFATDQRGIARPRGTADDIGAYEFVPPPEARINSTDCNLVDAITAANTDTATGDCAAGTGADTITLLRNITLTVANNSDNGLPIITTPITIVGAGYRIVRDSNAPTFRIFNVGATGNLALEEVTVSGGMIPGFGSGGGIYSQGILQLNRSLIRGNNAGVSGGIFASGVTTMTNSTISSNFTTAFGAGGIGNYGTMTLRNTTVTGNIAANLGGGFENGDGATLNLDRSLIAGNSAGTGPEIFNRSTINANAYNIFGHSNNPGVMNYTVGGTDIVPSVGMAAILNQVAGDNGGSTLTHALVEGSPAIDGATDSGFATDQRGIDRPQGAADDIGAYESPTLISMTVAIPDFGPSFDKNLISYTGTVTNTVTSVTISSTVSEPNAFTQVTVTPPGGSASTCTGTPISCSLVVGDNAVKVIVKAKDGTIAKTYTTIVTRAPSDDATLSDLVLESGILTPTFASNVLSYTASVTTPINSVLITPTVNEGNATVVVTVTPPGGAPIACTDSPISCPVVTGDNRIEVTVTAQDGTTTKSYTTTFTRPPSNDASLGGLELGTGDLAPAFNSNVLSYTASVSNVVSSLTLTPTVSEGNATTVVTVTPHGGVPIACSTDPIDCPLAVGENIITVTVTAEDGTVQTYTITVTREQSSDASLGGLELGTGDLAPAFNSNVLSYTASVSNVVSSLTLTPTVSEGNATTVVTVTPPGGSPIACSTDPIDCPLAVGENIITVTVTAEDGTVQTYTITVTREQSSDASLGGLELGTGNLAPTFNSNVLSYTASVSNVVSSLTLTPTVSEGNATTVVTVTPPGGSPIACSTDPIDCPLAVGENIITVTVTAEDGTVQTYTITVTREQSSDASLGGLELGTGNLAPAFNSNVLSYTASVSNVVSSLTLTPTVSEGNATTVVTVTPPGGSPIACSTDPIDCPLAVGENVIEVTVTAEDGTAQTYTITVTREQSSDASLGGLELGTGDLAPAFNSNVLSYTASVSNVVSSLTLTPTVSEGNATTVVTVTPPGGVPIACSTNPIDCPLAVGENVIEVTVTAEDGTVQTYTITVTREQSSDASLGGLELGTGDLAPAFNSNVLSYTASVSNVVSSLTLTPTVSEGNATTVVTVTPPGGVPIACSTDPIDCPLAVGENIITVTVTAEDGTVQTYTITVTREQSSDASLGGLELGTGNLAPTFNSNVLSYTASVSNVVSSLTLTPTVSEGNATTVVTVTPPGGSPIACSTNPIDCPLAVGENIITVTVTAEDGTVQTYTITVTLPAAPTATPTPTATSTDQPTATATPTATSTDLPTATATPTATSTDLPTATATPTATSTDLPTATATPTATSTDLPTATPTPTATSTDLPTATATPTATSTDLPTATPTATSTPIRVIAVNDAAGTLQGEAITISPLVNDQATAPGTLTIIDISTPTHGTGSIGNDAQRVSYVPNADFSGLDTFQYTVQHSSGVTATASIAVVVSTKTDSAAPVVIPINITADMTTSFTSDSHSAVITVPRGAYTGTLSQTDIFYIAYTPIVTPTGNVWTPPVGGLQFGDLLFTMNAFINDIRLESYHFPQPLTLTVSYAGKGEGLKPQSFRLYYWAGDHWATDGLEFVSIDEVNHTITYRVSHFTEFALFGTLSPTALDEEREPAVARQLYLPLVIR